MIFSLIQIATLAIVALYLGRWRTGVRRRITQSWESLVGRLRPDWSARELSDHFLWKEGLNATSEETWERIRGAHGIWAMYENAGVELAYAHGRRLTRAAGWSFSAGIRILPSARRDPLYSLYALARRIDDV